MVSVMVWAMSSVSGPDLFGLSFVSRSFQNCRIKEYSQHHTYNPGLIEGSSFLRFLKRPRGAGYQSLQDGTLGLGGCVFEGRCG